MSELTGTQPTKIKKNKPVWRRWMEILAWVLLIVAGITGGYWSGILTRINAQSAAIVPQIEEQYNLGIQALAEGKYQVAIQHFQFVIDHDPSFPGVQEKYVEALTGSNMVATSAAQAVPTITATPDLRNVEAIFNSARDMLAAENWDAAIQNLDSVRQQDATYRVAEVDGMYYIALRNRGISKILNINCDKVNLEGGMYDFALAERFGPLDGYSDGLRTWTQIYITGASFWELDWGQAVYYFGQMKDYLPNLVDASCMTATERYYYAAFQYAEKLAFDGDYCNAGTYYAIALENLPGQIVVDMTTPQYSIDIYNSNQPCPPIGEVTSTDEAGGGEAATEEPATEETATP